MFSSDRTDPAINLVPDMQTVSYGAIYLFIFSFRLLELNDIPSLISEDSSSYDMQVL